MQESLYVSLPTWNTEYTCENAIVNCFSLTTNNPLIMDFIEFLEMDFLHQLSRDVSVTIRRDSSDTNNLGVLTGVDLDSSDYSGYIYFWSKGFLDYALYSIHGDNAEIPTTVIETGDYKQLDIIKEIVGYFKIG